MPEDEPTVRAIAEPLSAVEAIIDALPVAIVVADDRGLIVLVNRQLERVFGYEREALLGKPLETIIPRRFRSDHRALYANYFKDPTERAMGLGRDLAGARADGSEFPLEIGLTPLHTEEGMLTLASIVDLTARKQAGDEALHEANRALEASNRELQQFVYTVSHDLQAPLRTITGFAQLLTKRYKNAIDNRADEWLTHITHGTTQMQALIRDLVTYSRIETRRGHRAPTDLGALVDELIRNFGETIRQSGASVEREELPTLRVDAAQIREAFRQLIANALAYAGDGPPRVRIRAERVAADASDGSPTEWIFAVSDHGIGIDPSHHESIFEVFRRLEPKHDYPGTGIGLAVARRVVQRHGGRIWVDSSLGDGSTFYFSLPESHPDEQDPEGSA